MQVVDVRGRDFAGGHIAQSVNLRATAVQKAPQEFVEEVMSRKITHVVFTCMYSVMRAPQCARAVADVARQLQNGPKISVLEKGLHGWMNQWRHSHFFAEYVHAYDPDLWMDAPSRVSEGGVVHVMDVIWTRKGHIQLVNALTELASREEERNEKSED